jgi:AhpD family alkylhydroperoxidase
MARISPQPVSEISPEILDLVASFRSAVLSAAPQEERDARPAGTNVLGTLARHPELAKAFIAFNGYVLNGSTLSARVREILILRVAVRRKCAYEWAQHVLLARDAGVTDGEIARITDGPGAPGWSPTERNLLTAVDELIARAEVSTPTWDALAQDLDTHQLMDLVYTVGTYEMVAMAFRSFGLEPEPDLAPYVPEGW